MRTLIAFLALSSAAAAQVTVSGTVRYEDKPYTSGGFTGATTFLPVRRADFEILRSGDNAVLASGVTADDGTFSGTFTGPNQVVRARFYARRKGGQINVEIQNDNINKQLYAVASPTIDTNITTTFGTLNITIASGGAPAFNIFDCAVKSFQYLASPAIQPSLPALPPLLKIFWYSGSVDGTYFDSNVQGIFLLGENNDPDQYDDDIILHEIGHWVAFNFSKDDTAGGPHSVIDQLDPRTSWSEGWAHYWSAAVRRFVNATFPSPEYSAPEEQVDNFQGGNSVFEIEGPSFPTQAIMATNELAVATVLWDLLDPANETFDTISGAETPIWTAVHTWIPTRTNITLEDFRYGLEQEGSLTMAAVTGTSSTDGIFKDRKIRYYPDANESNNTAGAATPLPLGAVGIPTQTFFRAVGPPENDEDWYSVKATPGTVVFETFNLGDGADTTLELYDATGTTLLDSNDDRTPGDLSSQITRVVAVPTTYLLRVRPFSPAVVEHGYYDVRAQIVPNSAPTISAATASTMTGPAPLRVTFSATVTDPDSTALQYQWDFDGDGVMDWSSYEGATVVHTYDLPGTYTAQFRVLDSGDSVRTANVIVTVTPTTAPTVALSPMPAPGTAPFLVNFDATVGGTTPVAYLWDFDGDGIIDRVSTTTPVASFTYRIPGTYFPRLIVRDSDGHATKVTSTGITVTAGVSPPSISSFSVAAGLLPFDSLFSVSHSDLGASGTLEFDVDGLGRYDRSLPQGSATGTSFSPQIRQIGPFTTRVRATDSAGLSVLSSTVMSSHVTGVTGWIVDPVQGDILSGNSLTLSAQALPKGITKSVQFQARPVAGAWTDIGAAIASTGTLFSTTWNVLALPAGFYDLRILIDGVVTSGDTADTVGVNQASPTLTENGGVRTRTVASDSATVARNAQGVWVLVPMGGLVSPAALTLQTAAAPAANGSVGGLVPVGTAWQVACAGTFALPYRIRIPFTGGGTNLEIHRYDAGSAAWQRVGYSNVSVDDGWVEADATGPGVFSAFDVPRSGGGGGGGGCGLTGLEAASLLALLRFYRRRRC